MRHVPECRVTTTSDVGAGSTHRAVDRRHVHAADTEPMKRLLATVPAHLPVLRQYSIVVWGSVPATLPGTNLEGCSVMTFDGRWSFRTHLARFLELFDVIRCETAQTKIRCVHLRVNHHLCERPMGRWLDERSICFQIPATDGSGLFDWP
jgi:hypothetical protein